MGAGALACARLAQDRRVITGRRNAVERGLRILPPQCWRDLPPRSNVLFRHLVHVVSRVLSGLGENSFAFSAALVALGARSVRRRDHWVLRIVSLSAMVGQKRIRTEKGGSGA